VVACTPDDIADAQRVRWIVYGEEEQLLQAAAGRGGREIDARDWDDDTVHLIVYAEDEPVGTVRLLPARRGKGGLDLESRFELAVRQQPGLVAGDVTRYCVKRPYRCTPVARMLHVALTSESIRRGITHWFAAVNMETDGAEEAALVYELVRARGLVDPGFHAVPRHHLPVRGRRRCYSDDEREAARGDGAAALRLPRTIALFTGKMGARCIGAPAYDPYFNVFALPIVAKVQPQPAFGAGVAARSPAMRSPATPTRP
jgi:hypothetical protein